LVARGFARRGSRRVSLLARELISTATGLLGLLVTAYGNSIEAMGRGLDVVSAGEARGFFEHRGYRVAAHPL
jgi:hypothetical protein